MTQTTGPAPADVRGRGAQHDQLNRYVRRTFHRTLRGYDPEEVDQHLERIRFWFTTAGFDQLLEDRREELLGSALESAEATKADAYREAQTTIQEAQRQAEAARRDAETTLRQARDAAPMLENARAEAESTLRNARIEAEAVLQNARVEAEAVLRDARSEADATVQRARREAQVVVDDAVRRAAAATAGIEQRVDALRTLATDILDHSDAPPLRGGARDAVSAA